MTAGMKQGRFYIMRHGETVFNAARRLQGDNPHTPLTRAGFAQPGVKIDGDDALGAGLNLADPWLQGRTSGGHDNLLGQQVAEGHGAEAKAGTKEEVASRGARFNAMAAWVVHST